MENNGRKVTFFEKSRLILATSIVTAALTSAYWVISYDLFGYNTSNGAPPESAATLPAETIPAAENASKVTKGAPAKRVQLNAVTPIQVGSLSIPVAGVKVGELTDTYSDSRGGGTRVHDAIDIMAKLGTPVIAAAPGQVEKIWQSENGGNTVYVRSPDRKIVYYYAHLDSYALSLDEGKELKPGDPIGTVGYSGNADPTAPHLHFAVMVTSPNESWSSGNAINPFPLLTDKR